MKRRSDRMQRVTDLAERRSDEAGRDVAARDRQLAEAHQQLTELKRFRHEYEAEPDGNGVGVSALLNRQRFLHRIDVAIVQQTTDIEQISQQLELSRRHWFEVRNRHTTLDGVTQRCRNEEQRADDRHEQDSIDERMQHRRGNLRRP